MNLSPTCKLYYVLSCVVCIVREVFDMWNQINLPVLTGKMQVTHINCVWGLFTCVFPQLKIHAFAGNAIVSKIYPYLRKSYKKTLKNIASKVAVHSSSSSIDIVKSHGLKVQSHLENRPENPSNYRKTLRSLKDYHNSAIFADFNPCKYEIDKKS